MNRASDEDTAGFLRKSGWNAACAPSAAEKLCKECAAVVAAWCCAAEAVFVHGGQKRPPVCFVRCLLGHSDGDNRRCVFGACTARFAVVSRCVSRVILVRRPRMARVSAAPRTSPLGESGNPHCHPLVRCLPWITACQRNPSRCVRFALSVIATLCGRVVARLLGAVLYHRVFCHRANARRGSAPLRQCSDTRLGFAFILSSRGCGECKDCWAANGSPTPPLCGVCARHPDLPPAYGAGERRAAMSLRGECCNYSSARERPASMGSTARTAVRADKRVCTMARRQLVR